MIQILFTTFCIDSFNRTGKYTNQHIYLKHRKQNTDSQHISLHAIQVKKIQKKPKLVLADGQQQPKCKSKVQQAKAARVLSTPCFAWHKMCSTFFRNSMSFKNKEHIYSSSQKERKANGIYSSLKSRNNSRFSQLNNKQIERPINIRG